MKPLVIDASVAIKWFVPEEAGREAALAVLDEIRSDPRLFVVPELFFNEMLAVLCKLVDDPRQIVDYLEALQQLGLERLGNGGQLLSTAATLAKAHGLSGYDAIYAASAQLIGGHWLTADERAHRRLQGLDLSRTLA